jgi:lysM domain protein
MLLLIKFFILMYNNGKGVIHMKKAFFFLLLSIAIFSLFTSCPTSPPSPKEEPQRIEEAPAKEPAPIPASEPDQPKPKEPVPEAEPKTVSVKKYTVVKGDILSRIALKHFGSLDRAYYFPIIMVMNEGIIKHPDKIRPGMTLNIPDFQEFMAHPEYRQKAKSQFEQCIKIYKREKKFTMMKRLQKRIKYMDKPQ